MLRARGKRNDGGYAISIVFKNHTNITRIPRRLSFRVLGTQKDACDLTYFLNDFHVAPSGTSEQLTVHLTDLSIALITPQKIINISLDDQPVRGSIRKANGQWKESSFTYNRTP